jgi:hypothetical protein
MVLSLSDRLIYGAAATIHLFIEPTKIRERFQGPIATSSVTAIHQRTITLMVASSTTSTGNLPLPTPTATPTATPYLGDRWLVNSIWLPCFTIIALILALNCVGYRFASQLAVEAPAIAEPDNENDIHALGGQPDENPAPPLEASHTAQPTVTNSAAHSPSNQPAAPSPTTALPPISAVDVQETNIQQPVPPRVPDARPGTPSVQVPELTGEQFTARPTLPDPGRNSPEPAFTDAAPPSANDQSGQSSETQDMTAGPSKPPSTLQTPEPAAKLTRNQKDMKRRQNRSAAATRAIPETAAHAIVDFAENGSKRMNKGQKWSMRGAFREARQMVLDGEIQPPEGYYVVDGVLHPPKGMTVPQTWYD